MNTLNLKDYNIKALNFNIIMDNIIIEFLEYLETYNLTCTYINKDIRNILMHFIINNIIKEIDNFSCILLYHGNFSSQLKNVPFDEILFIDMLISQLHKACKKLNIPVVQVSEGFTMKLEDIYNFKSLLDSRKPPNVRKIKKFLKDNNLVYLEQKVSTDRVLQSNLIK